MKKPIKIILIILAALVAVYIFLLVSTPIFYSGFSKISTKHVSIPDLSKDFVPQGVSRMEEEGLTVICGYMPGDENSRIYLIDEKTDKARLIKLLREDGSVYSGHAGGITVHGDYIYISNNRKIFVLSKQEALNTGDGETLKFLGYFDVQCRSSFCSSDENFLYVGEYFAEGYETEAGHKVSSSDGEHNALVFAYEFGEGNFDIKNTALPNFCLSVGDEVQGFALGSNGHAFLSCSASLNNSVIYEYDLSRATITAYNFEEQLIPMYVLDKKSAVRETSLPHMSEDLEIMSDGRMLVNFEAGANKFGRRFLPFTMKSVMAMDVKASGNSDAATKFKEGAQNMTISAENPDAGAAGGSEPSKDDNTTEAESVKFSTKSRDGSEFDDSLFADHELTMINFWEPWCGPCVNEMPELQKLYEEYCDLGFLILGVYSDTSMEGDVDYILESAGITYPILLDSTDFDVFRTPYVPTTVFVDRNGNVVDFGIDSGLGQSPLIIGANSYEGWESLVKSYLENQ